MKNDESVAPPDLRSCAASTRNGIKRRNVPIVRRRRNLPAKEKPMTWSPAQYTKFEAERNRPIHDLLGSLPNSYADSAIDLGCGPGNSTEILQGCFPSAKVTGIDSSPDMVAAARKRMPKHSFEVGDVSTWQGQGGPFDIILSNAVLQWVPDHERLIPALCAHLGSEGSLAVQMPDNMAEPAQTLMRDIAKSGPWAAKLKEEPRTPIHGVDWYYRALRAEVASVDIWRTTYHHPLAGAKAIVEWFKSTGLRPFIQPLDEAERAEYLARYEAAVAKAYPALPDGTVLLPFPRLFFVATR